MTLLRHVAQGCAVQEPVAAILVSPKELKLWRASCRGELQGRAAGLGELWGREGATAVGRSGGEVRSAPMRKGGGASTLLGFVRE